MKKVLMLILTILFMFSLCSCSNNLSNNSLRKILKENGYTSNKYQNSKIETSIDLKSDIKGLEKSGTNKLLLVNIGDEYTYIIVNPKTKKLIVPEFGYTPLNVVQLEIWKSDKDTNTKCINIFKKYIERNGINCLTEKLQAEKYLRDITTRDSVIKTSKAQDIISKSTTQMFPAITSNDDVMVLFEDGTAVPKYYAMQSTQMVYNWGAFWPEYQYEFIKSTLDRSTMSTLTNMYGPPYIESTIWAVVDSDLKEKGTYDSLEEVKEKLH